MHARYSHVSCVFRVSVQYRRCVSVNAKDISIRIPPFIVVSVLLCSVLKKHYIVGATMARISSYYCDLFLIRPQSPIHWGTCLALLFTMLPVCIIVMHYGEAWGMVMYLMHIVQCSPHAYLVKNGPLSSILSPPARCVYHTYPVYLESKAHLSALL